MRLSSFALCWLIVLALASCKPTPDDPPGRTGGSSASASSMASSVAVVPDPPGTYMGRRIAPTMSHEGADWLVRPEREAEERATVMLAELGLKPGDVACDFGSGNGYHTLEMAKRVAPDGRAVAIDIQPEMLALLRKRADEQHIANVATVLSTPDDPKLEAKSCDLILLADVYHELDDPARVLGQLRRALSPRGALALLEFRAEDPDVPIKPEHKMSKHQIMKEMAANELKLVRSFDELPWQHLMFFAPVAR